MRNRYDHLELQPQDIRVLRALSMVRYVTTARITRDVGLDPNQPADRTRVLSTLAYLRRRGLVTQCRLDIGDPSTWALTGLGESELAGIDQLRLSA